ncbi:hypothetical protein KV134_03820 [Tetragenococcus halophilus]|nr:hypothetical protein KV134_03820 [Tetragenococcus halophilus]
MMEEEANVEEIKKQNKQLLDEFEQELIDKKLSAKTIYKHVNNIDFYINTFLLYDEFVEAKKELCLLESFWVTGLLKKRCGQALNKSMKMLQV